MKLVRDSQGILVMIKKDCLGSGKLWKVREFHFGERVGTLCVDYYCLTAKIFLTKQGLVDSCPKIKARC